MPRKQFKRKIVVSGNEDEQITTSPTAQLIQTPQVSTVDQVIQSKTQKTSSSPQRSGQQLEESKTSKINQITPEQQQLNRQKEQDFLNNKIWHKAGCIGKCYSDCFQINTLQCLKARIRSQVGYSEQIPYYWPSSASKLTEITLRNISMNQAYDICLRDMVTGLVKENPNYKSQIGTQLYDFVEFYYHSYAPKITGMLIDLDIQNLRHLTQDFVLFHQWAQQAISIIDRSHPVQIQPIEEQDNLSVINETQDEEDSSIITDRPTVSRSTISKNVQNVSGRPNEVEVAPRQSIAFYNTPQLKQNKQQHMNQDINITPKTQDIPKVQDVPNTTTMIKKMKKKAQTQQINLHDFIQKTSTKK